MCPLNQITTLSCLVLISWLVPSIASTPSCSSDDPDDPICSAKDGERTEPSLLIRPVLRLPNITVEEYHTTYSRLHVQSPVVLENANLDWFKESDWTRKAILEECGDYPLHYSDWCAEHGDDEWDCHRIRYIDQDLVGKSWAAVNMIDLGENNLKTVRDLMEFQDTPEGRHVQMHDSSMKVNCPSAANRVKVPKYIDRDYRLLHYEQRDLDYRDPAPYWFISKKGTGSALHTDSKMERIYIQQLSGRKLWRTFPPSEYWRLYPNLEDYDENENHDGNGFYPIFFYADAINPDFERFPLLNGALTYDAILNPGDILIMPAGWPHQVLNLDDTIMTGVNYVDWDGMPRYNEYWQFMVGGLDVEEHPDFLLHTAFFLPLDPIPREGEDANVDYEDFFDHHHLARLPVPNSVVRWVERRSREDIDEYRGLGGVPALTLAVRFNFVSVVRYLVEEVGVDTNVMDAQGNTPLDWAVELIREGIVSRDLHGILLSNGALHTDHYLE